MNNDEHLEKLIEIDEILHQIYTNEEVFSWWLRPREDLDNQSPSEAVIDGKLNMIYKLVLSMKARN